MATAVNKFAFGMADVENKIADKTLRLAERRLIVYNLAEKVRLEKGRGLSFTWTRFPRLALPQYPLAEAVSSPGREMAIEQLTATVQQWADAVVISDVAEMGVKHPLVQTAQKLMGLQIAETLERNMFNTLMSGTQVAFVGSVGARASLLATSYLTVHELYRVRSLLNHLGAPMRGGSSGEEETVEVDGEAKARASMDNRTTGHYLAVTHTFPAQDLGEDSTAVNLWSYQDKEKIYKGEIGSLRGVRIVESNMVPTFAGRAAITGTAGTAGFLASGTYYVVVTKSDDQNQYESEIHQVSGGIVVTGPSGSISVVLPAAPGFTYNVYIGTTTGPINLATCPQGPLTGTMVGQATELAPGQTVTLTGIGVAKVPPAAPATGVTVYPTFVFGDDAFACVKFDDLKIELLTRADKSDKFNQRRMVTWKIMYGAVIKNQQFMARIESSAANSGVFN